MYFQAAEKFKAPEPVHTAISESKSEPAEVEESDDEEVKDEITLFISDAVELLLLLFPHTVIDRINLVKENPR